MKKILSSVFALFCLQSFSQSQVKLADPVKWTFAYEISKENPDEIILLLGATIGKDWHIYSQDVISDGPVPTTFTYKKDSLNFITVGKTEETLPEKKFDDAFQAELSYFSHSAVFKQKIKRVSKSSFKVTGELEFMCCNNMQCMPPKTVPFSIEIPAK